jgi:hypothetical protein
VRTSHTFSRADVALGAWAVRVVADGAGVTPKALLAKGREPWRGEAMRSLYELLRERKWSFPKIASFTGRDHSTVVQAVVGRRGKQRGGRGREFPLERAASNLVLLALRAGRVVS